MLGNIDRRQVVIGAVAAALVAVVAVTSFLTNRPDPEAAPGPGAVMPSAPAVPSSGPSLRGTGDSPATAVQDPGRAVATDPVAPYPGGGDSDEGRAFDINNPPAGAPTTADLRLARNNAVKYWEKMNGYGYGDAAIDTFLTSARPYMTDQNWEAVTDVMSQSSPSDKQYFDLMVAEKRRKVVEVDDVVVTSWTPDSVLFTVTYRSANNVSGKVPQTNMLQRVEVRVVADAGRWRVDSSKTA